MPVDRRPRKPGNPMAIADRTKLRDDDTGKMPKEDAGYRESEQPGMSCDDCMHYLDPNRCEEVAGDISPGGISDLFEPMQEELPDPGMMGPPGMVPPGGMPPMGGM